MNFGLKDKVAIISGSSKGLGKACAISLAKEGVHIVLCAKGLEALNATQKEIEALGVSVLALQVDMSLKEDNKRIVEETIARFGHIDVLVNNSGGPKPGGLEDLSDNDWDDAYNSILKYNIRMIQACVPYMKEKKWGRIINITSLSVKEPAPTLLLSNVFRAGVVSLAKSISKDLAGSGITINNVCPGAFKTERALELIKNRASALEITIEDVENQAVASFPQGRYQKPEELGDLVCFLASNNGAAITGTTIQIDGGISNSLF
jgi:3-oxoacyl-[acyl-carrier protein] reductase